VDGPAGVWEQLLAAPDAGAVLQQLAAASPLHGDGPEDAMRDLLAELAYLELQAAPRSPEEVELRLQHLGEPPAEWRHRLGRLYQGLFGGRFALQVETPEGSEDRLLLRGPGAATLAAAEVGTHVLVTRPGNLVLLPVTAGASRPLAPVVRVYQEHGPCLDLRTGLLCEREPTVGLLRLAVLAQLPVPRELGD
jgi:hypothetical protein